MYKFTKLHVENLASLFMNTLQQHGERNALWVNKTYYTYKGLYDSCKPIVKWISSHLDQRVLIFANRSIVAYQSILATMLSSKAYVPLNPNMPIVRNCTMSNIADTTMIVIDGWLEQQMIREFLKTLDATKEYHVLMMNMPQIKMDSSDLDNVHIDYIEDVCYQESYDYKVSSSMADDACLLFTSGSTGLPKGVMLSHLNIISYLDHTIERYSIDKDDRISQLTELTFDFAVQDMFMSWAVGACVYAFPENYFAWLPNYLNDNKITVMTTVPSTVRMLHNIGKLKPNSLPYLRKNIFGGEPFSDSAALMWQEAAPNTSIDNVCGPTEATVAYLAYTWDKDNAKNSPTRDCIPLGKPFPGQQIKLINENNQAVDCGEIGELCLSGSQVIQAYWCNPSMSAKQFINLVDEDGNVSAWYRTGDLVSWDEKDGIVFKGRVDDQIQIRGYRVEKLEIERVVREASQTEFVAVLPYKFNKDSKNVEGVIAVVSNTSMQKLDIIKNCRKILPDYMIPREIHIVDELPLNFNGKVDYISLRNMFMSKVAV